MRLKPIQNDECVESVKTCNSSSSGEAWLRLADSKKEKRKKRITLLRRATFRFCYDYRLVWSSFTGQGIPFKVVGDDTNRQSNCLFSVLYLDGCITELSLSVGLITSLLSSLATGFNDVVGLCRVVFDYDVGCLFSSFRESSCSC